jgi:general nucleoside transport system permease protein
MGGAGTAGGLSLLLMSFVASTVRLAAPLMLAAIAGLYAERSGVVDIGLEGKMLAAAFAGAAIASLTGSAIFGLAAGIAAALLLALLHGVAAIAARGDQIVSGMALNLIAAGATPRLASAWFGQRGTTPPLPDGARFGPITLPFAQSLSEIPVVGRVYATIISGHTLPVYLAWLAVPLTAFVLARTRFGLRLRATGESPEAVGAAGLSVARLRFTALVVNGALCGVSGVCLSMAQGNGFLRDMSAGRGYLALAALIFGKWRPWPVLGGCLLFAAADAVQARLQGVVLPGLGMVPVQLIQALPYLITVAILAGFVGRARPPRALGKPYPPTG